MYFPTGSVNKGGTKGEGIKPAASNYTIGPGNNFNGGGGESGNLVVVVVEVTTAGEVQEVCSKYSVIPQLLNLEAVAMDLKMDH